MDIKKLITDLQVCADDDIICPACERYDKMGIMGGTSTERLPEDLPENEGKKVINCIVAHCPYDNGKLTSQFRQRKWDKYYNKWHWSKIGGNTVTHWMPLPKPPKEVE